MFKSSSNRPHQHSHFDLKYLRAKLVLDTGAIGKRNKFVDMVEKCPPLP